MNIDLFTEEVVTLLNMLREEIIEDRRKLADATNKRGLEQNIAHLLDIKRKLQKSLMKYYES